jgi:hypothetical protein
MEDTNMSAAKPTKHNHQVCFGKREADCPRCEELSNGAAPRAGWQQSYFSRKAQHEASRNAAIKAHDFAGCAPCAVRVLL